MRTLPPQSLFFALLFLPSCKTEDRECHATADPADTGLDFDRVEGTSLQNACEDDYDCFSSGCSGEVCAAEEIPTTCEGGVPKPGGDCGCLDGICAWQECDRP